MTALDVITDVDTNTTLTVDVAANDPVPGAISAPVVVQGPPGAVVSVVANQLVFQHNGAGEYVVAYTSTIGAVNDVGFATIVITPPIGAGVPPTFGTSFQLGDNSNVAGRTLTIPAGTFGPNTRVILLGVGAWKDFGTEVETITSLPTVYDGNAMTRIDTHDNLFRIGDDGGGVNAVGPASYVFALVSTPTFQIPTDGDISWTFNLTGGVPELHMAAAVSWEHPTSHLSVSELGNIRPTAVLASSTIPATASNNSGVTAFSTHKRQVVPVSQAGWTRRELVTVDNAQDIQSGRFQAETRVFATGGVADYLIDSDQNNLHGGTVVQVQDPAAGVAPPTVQTLTAEATTGGSTIQIDMSTTGGTPRAFKLESGEGVVGISGNNLTFTPPATDQVSVVKVSVSNAGGAVISQVTINTSTVSFGPRFGPGVGVGLTGTTALSAVVNQIVANSVRPALEAAHDRGLTDQEIRNANPGFTDLFGTTGADLLAEFSAGRRNLILRNDRQYNWSDIANNQNTPTAGIQLVGLNGANVILGGTPKNAGQRRWQIRGDVRLEGIDFRDGAILLSAVGLTSTVNEVSIRHCKSTNLANLFHHELDNGVSNNLFINQLTIRNNICTNVRDGVNARLGNGLTGPLGTIVNADIQDNIIDGWTRYGIALHYDTPPAGFNYNAPIFCGYTVAIIRTFTV